MKKNFLVHILLVTVLLMSLIGNATAFENLSCMKEKIRNYYLSGEYESEVKKIVQEASKSLTIKKSTPNEKLAIVLDIDDTSLSNFDALNKDDFSMVNMEKFHMQGNSLPIKPILDLYNMALKKGISVFFISSRSDELRQATIKNLAKAGYHHWQGIFLVKGKVNYNTHKINIRKGLIQQGYHIILNIGDQDSDLRGGFADKAYKIPNPLYSYASEPCEQSYCN